MESLYILDNLDVEIKGKIPDIQQRLLDSLRFKWANIRAARSYINGGITGNDDDLRNLWLSGWKEYTMVLGGEDGILRLESINREYNIQMIKGRCVLYDKTKWVRCPGCSLLSMSVLINQNDNGHIPTLDFSKSFIVPYCPGQERQFPEGSIAFEIITINLFPAIYTEVHDVHGLVYSERRIVEEFYDEDKLCEIEDDLDYISNIGNMKTRSCIDGNQYINAVLATVQCSRVNFGLLRSPKGLSRRERPVFPSRKGEITACIYHDDYDDDDGYMRVIEHYIGYVATTDES